MEDLLMESIDESKIINTDPDNEQWAYKVDNYRWIYAESNCCTLEDSRKYSKEHPRCVMDILGGRESWKDYSKDERIQMYCEMAFELGI
jgi:hypothetical protein